MALLTDIFPRDITKPILDRVPEIQAWYRSFYYRIGANSFTNLVDVSGKGRIGTGTASINASNEIVFNGTSNIINLPIELVSPFNGLEIFLKVKFLSLPNSVRMVLGYNSSDGDSSFFIGNNTANRLFLGHGTNSVAYNDTLGNSFTLNTTDYYIINAQILTSNPRFTVMINNSTTFTTNTTLVDSFATGNFVLGAFRQGETINSWANFSLKEAIFCSPLTAQKRELLYNFCAAN